MESVTQNGALDQELTLEEVKQVVLNLFYALYVYRNMDRVTDNISNNIQWDGTKDFHIAHNKEELLAILNREISNVKQFNWVRIFGKTKIIEGNKNEL